MAISMLRQVNVNRFRYGSMFLTDAGMPVRPTPTLEVIKATVQPAPDSLLEQLPSGQRSTDSIALISYSELRTARDFPGDSWLADIIGYEGKLYEVQGVTKSPQPRSNKMHWIATAVEVSPLQYPEAIVPMDTYNLILPAIQGIRGSLMEVWPGLWHGVNPFEYTYQWFYNDVPIDGAIGPIFEDVDPDGTLTVEVTATGFDGNSAAAFSQPLGGGDCSDAWLDGYNEGYTNGEIDGYNEGYPVGFVDGYSEGFDYGEDFGYSEGYPDGYNEGYPIGFDDGYQEGYPIGYGDGFNHGNVEGYNNGYNVGYSAGYGVGYGNGEIAGYNSGHLDGYSEGFGYGEIVGYDLGFNDGEIAGYSTGYPIGYNEGEIAGYGAGFNAGYPVGQAEARAWQRVIEMPGAVWSDPLGLVSSHTEVDGVLAVTLNDGIATPEPDTFAGWEAPLAGTGDMLPDIIGRLIPEVMPGLNGSDALMGIVLSDGPRATATQIIAWCWGQNSGSAGSYTVRVGVLSGGVWVWGTRLGALDPSASLVQCGSTPDQGANGNMRATIKTILKATGEFGTTAQQSHSASALLSAFADPYLSIVVGATLALPSPVSLSTGALVSWTRPDHMRMTP